MFREPGSPLTALLVEDEPAESATAVQLRLLQVRTADAACNTLRQTPVDAVILDLSLPDASGLEALGRIRAISPDTPVVVLGSHSDETIALEALRTGAQDYVRKPPPDGATMRRIVRYACERQRLLRKMQHEAAARDRVASIVAHDLQNPLSTIQICASALLESPTAPPSGVRQMGLLIQRSASVIQQIAEDLLARASLNSGGFVLQRTPTDVVEVIDTILAVFGRIAAERSIDLVVERPPHLPLVDVDSHRLVQVLSNLMSNALKFTPSGGRIDLSAVCEDESPDAVRFSVSDSGPGIPAEELPHLFEWFWHSSRGSKSGVGLGLAIAKSLVEAHSGQLRVDSVPGRGSTFWFTVPAATASVGAPIA